MNKLPEPSPGSLWLVLARRAAQQPMLDLAARLAQRGPVQVLDGGNSFNAYIVARSLGRWAGEDGKELEQALKRISVARAFTCYQVLTLLSETPTTPYPTLVLDLLATFYDENVELYESQRLLESCLGHLLRLSRLAPVIISAQAQIATQPVQDRNCLVQTLETAAHQVLYQAHNPPVDPQLRLPF
ncbi:MAG: hypothetical protein R6V73_10100 [Anaerolineales bacterium]